MSTIDILKEKVKNGTLNLLEFAQLCHTFIYESMLDVARLAIDGKEKRELVLSGASAFFDIASKNLFPGYLVPIRTLIRPYVKQIYLIICSAILESLYNNIIKNTENDKNEVKSPSSA